MLSGNVQRRNVLWKNTIQLVYYELSPWRRWLAFFGMALGAVFLLYVLFTSESMQFWVFMLFRTDKGYSYYHIIATPFFAYLIPFLCMVVAYDSVSKDISEKHIRLIVSAVRRSEYILAKFFSRFLLMLAAIVIYVGFLTAYSMLVIGKPYLAISFNLFVSMCAVSAFLVAAYVLLSTFAASSINSATLLWIVLIILSVLPYNIPASPVNYVNINTLNVSRMATMLFGAAFFIITNIFLFERKRL